MNRWRLLIVGAVGAVLGLVLVLVSGVLNFAASSGHWDVTDLFFDLAARQSVTLRSTGIDVPDLDDPARVLRGAGHYEMVCAACHGSTADPPDAIAANLTPKPPLLVEQLQRWRPPERLFWTVKHGIKRTAMPAWATQLRDDEVWDMVAFLRAMPELSADAYRALAGDRRVASCINCHGEDGRGRSDAIPRLDIQSPEYLADALRAFRAGTRQSGTMMTAARTLSDDEIADLAARYGRREVSEPETGSGAGEAIARRGIPEREIPACDACHGGPREDYPRLAGQSADYIERQLQLFAELGEARGGRYASIMSEVVRSMTPEEIRAVAEWYGASR
jgi:cytochrome c553